MKELTKTQHVSLAADTQIGDLALTVADLERSVRFYEDVLGFKLLDRSAGTATLGTAGSTPLLHLVEQPGARPMPQRSTGLYHFAVLFPSRVDLARALLRIADHRYPLQGASDHLVSEAIYLADPDNNGIEIYRDRQREEWPRIDGNIQMATDPLDLYALLAEAGETSDAMVPEGTRIGHMHLQVADIPAAEAFYVDLLGFDTVFRMPSALFVSAGGYHHHIGLNTWQSRGGAPAPAGSAGLRHFTIELPDRAELQRVADRLQEAGLPLERTDDSVTVADPWRNHVRLAVATA